METEDILILMAAYNGARFIREQINSILEQNVHSWRLIISDDESTDGTPEIVEEYASRYPGKINHHCSGRRFGNARDHFLYLLRQFHDAPYIMFCDQDDIWHKDKITKTLKKMKEIEASGVPALVHTDMRVVDRELNQIAPSHMKYIGIQGDRLSLNTLLVQNVVSGCTVMFNRALTELAVKNAPTEGILMHDWWLALIASATGRIAYLDEPTVDYRQHGDNTLGARSVHSLAASLLKRAANGSVRERLLPTFAQAAALKACLGEDLSEADRSLLEGYGDLSRCGPMRRRAFYLRHRCLKCGFMQTVGQLIWP